MLNYPNLSNFFVRGACVPARAVRIMPFCVFCLSSIVLVSSTRADEAADLTFIRTVNPVTAPKPKEIVHFNPRLMSELKLTATGLIRLYQIFISSQDGPRCSFVPTCSRFGMTCIEEFGIVRSLLLTADRLLRCNGSQSGHYHRDEATGKYIDPVSDYTRLK